MARSLEELVVAINLIVFAVSLLMAGFILVWLLCPQLRPWMEAPKYRILKWDAAQSAKPDDPT